MNTIQNNKKNNNNKVGDLTVLKIKTYRSWINNSSMLKLWTWTNGPWNRIDLLEYGY
jgi:hypothetical protein